mmetsp:Transcript_38246/g.89799  ORF Transcript_38246/g.89799 Transcript_38246/m.89799 type:complete len:114 (+) Transcript_38246:69-410(+)
METPAKKQKVGSLTKAYQLESGTKVARGKTELEFLEAVRRCFIDNFEGFTHQEIYGTPADGGPTLFATIVHDKRLWFQGKITMGGPYYDRLRGKFGSKTSARAQRSASLSQRR